MQGVKPIDSQQIQLYSVDEISEPDPDLPDHHPGDPPTPLSSRFTYFPHILEAHRLSPLLRQYFIIGHFYTVPQVNLF